MKVNRIFTIFCSLLLICITALLSACKNDNPTDFNIDDATSIITKLETEDDSFFSAISKKYKDDTSSQKLESLLTTIGEINESVKVVVTNFTTYKTTLSSSEYSDRFSFDENFFKYEKDDQIIDISFSKGEWISVKTFNTNTVCCIEIKMLRSGNYASRCFIKNSASDYGEEVLYYFNGSTGRIRSTSCIETKSKSIFDYDDLSTTFAQDEGSGYYFFT